MKLLHKFKSSSLLQSVAAFAIRCAAAASSFILFALISRYVGPSAFGQFSMYFSVIMTLGVVGSFGQQIFLIKEVTKARSEKATNQEKGAFVYSLFCTLLFGSFSSILCIGVFYLYFPGLGADRIAMWGAILVFLYALSQTLMGALRVHDRTLYAMASRDLLWRIICIATISLIAGDFVSMDRVEVVFVVLSCGLFPIVVSHLAQVATRVWKEVGSSNVKIKWRSWTDTSSGMLLVSLISSSDIYVYTLVIGFLLSPLEAGAFFAALKTVEVLNIFLMAVTLVVAPKIAKSVADRDRDMFQLTCNKAIIMQGVPVAVACVIVFVGAEMFMGLFSSEFARYSNVLRLLAVGMLINAMTGATVLILQLIGKHWIQVGLQGGALFLAVLLLPLLCNQFGVYGAGLSFILSKLIWNVGAIMIIKHNNSVDPSLLGLMDRRSGGIRAAILDIRGELTSRADSSDAKGSGPRA